MNPENSREQRPRGRPFKPGTSGNPGGRPRVVAEVRELARAHGAEAVEALVQLMRRGAREETRVRAAEALLDRGYGRPAQAITGDGENPLALLVEQGDGLLARLQRLAGGDPAGAAEPGHLPLGKVVEAESRALASGRCAAEVQEPRGEAIEGRAGQGQPPSPPDAPGCSWEPFGALPVATLTPEQQRELEANQQRARDEEAARREQARLMGLF